MFQGYKSFRLLIYLLLLSFAVVLSTAGCKEKGNVGKVTPKVLTIGLDKNIETLDILQAADPLVWYPGHQINETLVVPDYDMKPRPLLAKSWERIDRVTWKFYLRKGVKFHDGTPFNAKAVKYSLERQQKEGPKWASPPIKSIEVEDDYTIVITTDRPFSPLIEWLMNPIAAIVSPTAVEKFKDDFGKHPCGTGPYKLEEFIPEQRIVLVRNKEYWGSQPKLEKIIYKVITDPNARLMALQAGEVDIVRDLPLAEVSKLETDQRFKVLKTTGVRTHYFGFNAYREHFKDVRVRQAFNYAINREAIVTHVMHGIGQPAKGFVAPTVPGHLAVEGYPYNPEKAKQLLAVAGWSDTDGDGILDKNGKPFKITLVMQPWTAFWKPAAEALQGQLKEIGIDMSIKIMEKGAVTEAIKRHDFDLTASCSPAVHGGADYQLMSRFHSTFNPETHACHGYVNKRVDELLELARQEIDESKRMKMYQEVQRIIHQDAVAIPYAYDVEAVAANARVKGFKPHPAVWAVDLTKVDIEGQ